MDRNTNFSGGEGQLIKVALRKESVDRNDPPVKPAEIGPSRSPQGERG